MNSPEHQKYLDELAEWFFKKFTKKELCRRIAEAVTVQDSCGACAELNMKSKLQTGEDGYLMCARCMDEYLTLSNMVGNEKK